MCIMIIAECSPLLLCIFLYLKCDKYSACITGKSNTQPATKPVGMSKTAAVNQPHSSTIVPVCDCFCSVVYTSVFYKSILPWTAGTSILPFSTSN